MAFIPALTRLEPSSGPAQQKERRSLVDGTENLEAMHRAVFYRSAMCRLIASKLGIKAWTYRAGVILDFGAGKGAYADVLSRKGLWGVRRRRIACIEASDALREAYDEFQPRGKSLDQVGSGVADAAYSLNVLEHLPDDVAALKKLASKCVGSAPIFILVPAHMHLWTAMDDAVGHVRRYSKQSLHDLAQAAGLDIVEEGWFDRTGYLATLTLKLLTMLRLKSARWGGSISATEVAIFDAAFLLLEPILRWLPFGKNRWILVKTAQDIPLPGEEGLPKTFPR